MRPEDIESIPTTRVGSWTELMDALYEGSWNPMLLRHRCPVVFRGMALACNDLSTTLLRLRGGHGDLGKLEGHLLRNFRKYAHSDAAAGDSIWNWLALAAHHGLPTRLLDWTYSPFVALHFATKDLGCYGEDGVVWCVNHRQSNVLLPDPLRRALDQEGSDVFTGEMLSRTAGTLEHLQQLSPEAFVLFLEPPSIDARIVNQFALFSLVSSPERALHDWLAAHPSLCRRIVLPAELKWEIRDKLDQAGITERVLFPGLDGLTAWLTRYYTSRNAAILPGSARLAPANCDLSNQIAPSFGCTDREKY